MKLTPLDIRHKEFKRGMRGYADVEVDEFLDQVADEYERLFKENIDLQDRVEALRGEGRRLQAHRGHAAEDARQRAGQRRGAEAERQQAGAAHPAGRRAQGAPDGERGVLGTPVHRAVDGQAQERRRGLPLQVPPAARRLPAPAAGDAGGERDGRRPGSAATSRATRRPSRKPSPASRCRRPAATPAPAPERAEAPEPTAGARCPLHRAPRPRGRRCPTRPRSAGARARRRPGRVHAEPADGARRAGGAGGHHEPAGSPGGGRPRDHGGTARPRAGRRPTKTEPRRRERILFGESDDLLADVDTGVNENEFKW